MPELIDDLKGEIAAGRVVALIGAGVSVSATGGAPVANWTGLLCHGTARCAELYPDRADATWLARQQQSIDSRRTE